MEKNCIAYILLIIRSWMTFLCHNKSDSFLHSQNQKCFAFKCNVIRKNTHLMWPYLMQCFKLHWLQLYVISNLFLLQVVVIPWHEIATSRPFWAIMASTFCSSYSFFTLLTELPTYFNKILHFDMSKVRKIKKTQKWMLLFFNDNDFIKKIKIFFRMASVQQCHMLWWSSPLFLGAL